MTIHISIQLLLVKKIEDPPCAKDSRGHSTMKSLRIDSFVFLNVIVSMSRGLSFEKLSQSYVVLKQEASIVQTV